MISIDDFKRMELKVATITKAEPHPNADKLLVLQVDREIEAAQVLLGLLEVVFPADLGHDQRQIVAGIKEHYTAEELVGRQVVVVANLETARLRGMESHGMLLAASDGCSVVVLTVEKSVQPGAKVS